MDKSPLGGQTPENPESTPKNEPIHGAAERSEDNSVETSSITPISVEVLENLPTKLQLEALHAHAEGLTSQILTILQSLESIPPSPDQPEDVLRPRVVDTSPKHGQTQRTLHWMFGVNSGSPIDTDAGNLFTPLISDDLGKYVVRYPFLHWRIDTLVSDVFFIVGVRDRNDKTGVDITARAIINHHSTATDSNNITIPTRLVDVKIDSEGDIMSLRMNDKSTDTTDVELSLVGMSPNIDEFLAGVNYSVRETAAAYKELREAT